jgi:FtsP/CotA-like multicopper oxidase with cupredoxin domain
MNRRAFIAGAAALTTLAPGRRAQATAAGRTVHLTAAPASQHLAGAHNPATGVWAYDKRVPGPEIRVRRRERLRLSLENRLSEPTTLHAHGIRLPNAMDGVPHLTQKPIEPGETFVYDFVCPDAGTFWYHPHVNSAEQVGRGLYGALIVEERRPPPVDRDIVWLLDDWRLDRDAVIDARFRNLHDMTHAGRLGNMVTVNGGAPETFAVRTGERIRLRLINGANARAFALTFEGHEPQIIAIDGQPVEPHAPDNGRIVLGPAMRADVILDCRAGPGERFVVRDDFYRNMPYRLFELVYDATPLRDHVLEEPVRLAANPVPEPDLQGAVRHQIVLSGGMMGRMTSAQVDGRELDVHSMFQNGVAWAMNGIASTGHHPQPMLTLARDRSCVVELINDTAWPHPMHLHGHSFRVLSRNGRALPLRPWQDTVLLLAREWVEIAFVADNPGDWMFHCHILEHQMAGMMGVIRVA